MKSNLIRNFISVIVFFLFNAYAKTSYFFPQRIIFIRPQNLDDFKIYNQLIDEIVTVFEILDNESKIVYVKEKIWDKYKNLIEDFSNRDKIAKFFLYTSVTGIIGCKFEKVVDKLTCKFYFYDLKKNRINFFYYEILNSELIIGTKNLCEFLKNAVEETFPLIDIRELRKEKIRFRISTKENPFYELFLSGGSGFCSRQSFLGIIYSSGFPLYFNIEQKIRNFTFILNITELNLFNEAVGNNNFLYDINIKATFSFWFIKQTFRSGAGFSINVSNCYLDQRYYKENEGDIYKVRKLDLVFAFLFLDFSIRPTETFLFIFEIGSFFSFNYMFEIFPFPFFPIYWEFGIRYNITKNFFYEMSVPFYIFGYLNRRDNTYNPSFTGIIKTGFGWYWKKEKE